MMNLRHLVYMLDIAEVNSISKAAVMSHLSQSALTQGLTRIENELGTQLFDRQPSGVFLTKAGEIFMARVSRALNHLQAYDRDQSNKNNGSRSKWIFQKITTAQLRCVIATNESGSFSHAAASLSLSQPTVQRAVRDVEERLNTTLFVRAGRGVNPTFAAQRLSRLGSLAFAEIEQGVDEVNEYLGTVTSRLAIGSLPLARTELVPTSATMLLEKYPNAQIRIVDGSYNDLLRALRHSQVDLILGALRYPVPVSDIIQSELFDEYFSVVVRAGHPLLDSADLDLHTLSSLSWVAPPVGTPARERFRNIFLSQGLSPPSHVIECSCSIAVRGLLLKSNRAALLSSRQIEPEIDANLLSILPIQLNSGRKIGLALRKGWRPTAVQRTYLDIVNDLVGSYV